MKKDTFQTEPEPMRTVFQAAVAKNGNLIGEKIREERKARKQTLSEFAESLEQYGIFVKKSAVSKWEMGDTVPTGYQMLALLDLFGVKEPADFFSGRHVLNREGRKKLSDYRDDLIATGKYRPAETMREIRYKEMPVSLLAASAGTGNFLGEENLERLSVPEKSVPVGADFGIKICGDSMEPVYSDGQLVWVKKCTRLYPGEVGIFMLDGCGYIKEYGEQDAETPELCANESKALGRQPILISYNRKYAPIAVSADQILQIVGKVL